MRKLLTSGRAEVGLIVSTSYGLCVSGTLFCTTLLLSLVMFYVRGWNVFIAVGFFLLSGFIDALFFSSSLQKVPHGAWFTLVLSVVLGAFLCFWTWAKNLEDRYAPTPSCLFRPDVVNNIASMQNIDCSSTMSSSITFRARAKAIAMRLTLQFGKKSRLPWRTSANTKN